MCWLDMSGYSDVQVSGAGQGFSFTLNDGSTLSFTLKGSATAPNGSTVAAASPQATPVLAGASVGNTSFLGIAGKPALVTVVSFATTSLTLSAITLTPPAGVSAPVHYQVIMADAEATINRELLSFTTNGGNWTQVAQLPPASGSLYPTITNTGTIVTETGGGAITGGYAFGTSNPGTIGVTIRTSPTQAIMIGVRTASIAVATQLVGARVAPSDQFSTAATFTSGGPTLASVTSSGTGSGPFNSTAAFTAIGVPLTVSETMAAGSASALSQYTTSLTCVNAAAGSATTMPVNVVTTSYALGALAFGDMVTCTFTNTPKPAPLLSISMAVPTPTLTVGINSTYVLTVTNTGSVAASTARVIDILPAGLTFVLADGPNWTCAAVGQIVTCDFAGSTIAVAGSSAINLVVMPTAAFVGTSITNYASVDPTSGSAPPSPGASCAPDSACANVPTASILPDPASTAAFIVIKTVDKDTAELGDVVKYTIDVRLVGTGAIPNVTLSDQLPRGFGYIPNTASVELNGGAAALRSDAALSLTPHSALLNFALGTFNPGDDLRLSYDVRIGAGAQSGDGINRATVIYGTRRSATAQVQVKVTSGVFWNEACIFGHVYIDKDRNSLKDVGEPGLANVRLYLEDGTWFITDDNGKYSFCGLSPITHVIGIDQTTLPKGSVLEITSNRNALDPASLFLDVQYGELMRADFAVMPPAKKKVKR